MSAAMTEPLFLTLDEVLLIHAYQVENHGGDAAVLDIHKLESAIAQPRQMFAGEYLHADLAAMAAAYLFHIVGNHPFADGNKRTGTHAALTFLDMNGHTLELDLDEAEQLVLSVAKGELDKQRLTTYFRNLLSTG